MHRPLVIFIVGTTAVGKTKLSIQLSKAIGGQVINCDSKQLYKYANIMTAKADNEQRQGIVHHMIDILQLHQNCYNRNKYFAEAMKTIQDIQKRGKIPIVVGGTNYYLQTLLYNINMNNAFESSQININTNNSNKDQNSENNNKMLPKQEDQKQKKQIKHVDKKQRMTKQQFELKSKQQRYAYLKEIDPIMGEKLHRNDENRINSFLLRYIQSGIIPSQNYKPLSHQLRFPKQTILFWIRNENKKQLHELMQKRINKMVDAEGLRQIIAIFKYAEMYELIDQLKMSALQSIGYKQFLQCYQQIKQFLNNQQFNKEKRSYEQILQLVDKNIQLIKQKLNCAQSKSIRNNKKVSLLQKCKQVLIKNTIDYSKRQVTWLRNRIFACEQNRSNFFILDIGGTKGKHEANVSLMTRFDKNVKARALQIIQKITTQGIGSVKQNIKQFTQSKHQSLKEWKKYYCQSCKHEVNGKRQWQQHLRSRKHQRSTTKKLTKKQKWQKKIQENSSDSENEQKSQHSPINSNQKIQNNNV